MITKKEAGPVKIGYWFLLKVLNGKERQFGAFGCQFLARFHTNVTTKYIYANLAILATR